MKVDALEITGQGPHGEAIEGHACSECGREFFDALSSEGIPQVVETSVQKFIRHADEEHHSDV